MIISFFHKVAMLTRIVEFRPSLYPEKIYKVVKLLLFPRKRMAHRLTVCRVMITLFRRVKWIWEMIFQLWTTASSNVRLVTYVSSNTKNHNSTKLNLRTGISIVTSVIIELLMKRQPLGNWLSLPVVAFYPPKGKWRGHSMYTRVAVYSMMLMAQFIAVL